MLRPIIAALVLAAAAPAAAQSTARWEASGGYAMLNDTQVEPLLHRGWLVGVAAPVGSWLSIAGEASGISSSSATLDGEARLMSRSFLAGVRTSAPIGRLTEFLQIVAGDVRGRATLFGVTDARHAFAVQPGAGLDVPLLPHVALRGQMDVRFIRRQAGAINATRQVRFVASFVYYRDNR